MTELTLATFEDWLTRYGAAWEHRDGEAGAALFATHAEYYWTSFEEPKRGRAEIAAALSHETARQTEVSFSYRVLALAGSLGIAGWRTQYRRVGTGELIHLDGVLTAEMDNDGLCVQLREWWHTTESSRKG
jgi:hypothetical protein